MTRRKRSHPCANCGAAADVWRYCRDCTRMCAKLLLLQVTAALAAILVGHALRLLFR